MKRTREWTNSYQRGGVGEGGREKGIEGHYDWHTQCVGVQGEGSVTQRRQVVTL